MKISALALVAMMAQSVDAKGKSEKEPKCYTEEFLLAPSKKAAYPVVDFKHYLVRDTELLLYLCV